MYFHFSISQHLDFIKERQCLSKITISELNTYRYIFVYKGWINIRDRWWWLSLCWFTKASGSKILRASKQRLMNLEHTPSERGEAEQPLANSIFKYKSVNEKIKCTSNQYTKYKTICIDLNIINWLLRFLVKQRYYSRSCFSFRLLKYTYVYLIAMR